MQVYLPANYTSFDKLPRIVLPFMDAMAITTTNPPMQLLNTYEISCVIRKHSI